MANRIAFERTNDVDGKEVSLLIIYPLWVMNPPLGGRPSGHVVSGFVDLPCDNEGNFPEYIPSELTFDGQDFNVTYSCNSPITLSSTEQTYQTVMLPLYLDQTMSIVYNQNYGVNVTIIFPDGSMDGNGQPLSKKIKKGQPSTQNPHIQPDLDHPESKSPHVFLFNESSNAVDTNTGNNFGVPRIQLFQSYTQRNQFFALVVATNVTQSYLPVSTPCNFDLSDESTINMVFNQCNEAVSTQVIGGIASSPYQFSGAITSNNSFNTEENPSNLGLPNSPYPVISDKTLINNNPKDSKNDYDFNALLM